MEQEPVIKEPDWEWQLMIVTRAADGKSALAQFCNTDPGTFDLILMDIMMPEMNGYETTKAIRNLSDRPDGRARDQPDGPLRLFRRRDGRAWPD